MKILDKILRKEKFSEEDYAVADESFLLEGDI
jgi:hypothetical protein